MTKDLKLGGHKSKPDRLYKSKVPNKERVLSCVKCGLLKIQKCMVQEKWFQLQLLVSRVDVPENPADNIALLLLI